MKKLATLMAIAVLAGCGGTLTLPDFTSQQLGSFEVGCEPVSLTVNGETRTGLNSVAVTEQADGSVVVQTEPDFEVDLGGEPTEPEPPEPNICVNPPTEGYVSGPDLDLSGNTTQITMNAPTVRKLIIPEGYDDGLQLSLGSTPTGSGYMTIAISQCRNYDEGKIETCASGGASSANLRIMNTGGIVVSNCEGIEPGEWYAFFGRSCTPGNCQMVQATYK